MLAILQKAFAGTTSARAKLGMILASNLFISPIQQSVYIAAMAIINGATTPQAIINAWKMSIWRVMKLSWVVSTVSMAIAQRFLAPEIWGAFSTLGRGSHPTCGRTDLLYLAQCRSSPYVQVEPTELSDQREDFLELTRLPLGTAYRPVRWNSHQHPGEP